MGCPCIVKANSMTVYLKGDGLGHSQREVKNMTKIKVTYQRPTSVGTNGFALGVHKGYVLTKLCYVSYLSIVCSL